MKERQLIKVVGTLVTGLNSRYETEVARGITLLKRGQDLRTYIHLFLMERGITHYSLAWRAEQVLATELIMLPENSVLSYTFYQFPQSEFPRQARDLTRVELMRDAITLRKVVLNG